MVLCHPQRKKQSQLLGFPHHSCAWASLEREDTCKHSLFYTPKGEKETTFEATKHYQTQHLDSNPLKKMIKKTPPSKNKGENIFQTPHKLHVTSELKLRKFQDLVERDSS